MKRAITVQNSKILILSCEDGFQNSKFILKEDLTSERSYTRYFNSMNNIAEAEKSIKEFYDKKKEEEKKVVTRQINEMQKKIDKKKARENDKQSELISLENKKDGEKRSKDALQSKVNSVEQDIEERRRLWQDIENLKVKLNNLFPHRSSDSYEEAAERGNLRAVINNLKQELTQHKQNVESTNVELQQELITLETETATLINNIAKLATEETVDDNLQRKIKDIIKRLSDLQLQEAQLDPLEESGEKGKLRAAADNLKQKLALLKQSTESKKVELLEQLTELGTKVTNLESEINRLQEPEKTIEAFKKEKGILEESIKQHEKEIKKLDDEIKKYEKEKEYLRNVISQLQKDKKEIEDGNNKVAEQERHKQLDGKRDKEIKLVKELIIQEKNDNVDQSKYKSIEIFNLINKSYKEAYIKGSEAILAPEEQPKDCYFYGFYGIYLWEIFFHIPTLVAYLFNQEQKFAEARRWYQYVFNPTNRGCNAWQFLPFKTKCGNSYGNEKCDSGKLIDLLDPYKEADKKKISYEKYVIMSYVDNLVDWGDMLFSQASWEGINEATMLYIRAWDLLGEKPKKKEKFNTTPKSVCKVLTVNMEVLCVAELRAPVQSSGAAPSRTLPDNIEYCSYFCTPENKDFIGLWDRIEDRLYKIRHCLDIKGKRLELPLFQPPIDPKQLISAAAGGSTVRLPKIAQVPHYRFKYMITYAKSIADTVTQIGSELLSVLEKKDAEALNLFYNKQEAVMANLMTTIKEKAIEALKEEAKVLNTSLSSAKDRKSHYEKLIKNDLSSLERKAFDLAKEAIEKRIDSSTLRGLAAALHLIPTVFGLACGSFQPGSAAEIAAIVSESEAMRIEGTASEMVTKASYQRREEDWSLQEIMATHDVEQIGYQIEANTNSHY